jgi:hypothetical protein
MAGMERLLETSTVATSMPCGASPADARLAPGTRHLATIGSCALASDAAKVAEAGRPLPRTAHINVTPPDREDRVMLRKESASEIET